MYHSIRRPYRFAFIPCLGFLFLFLWPSGLKAEPVHFAFKAVNDTLPETISDTLPKPANDSFFLLKSKGLLGKLARSIVTDTSESDLVRIDVLYQAYTGRIIRNIQVRRLDFGVPLDDTSRSVKNILTRWADVLHHTTREQVIRNNLFFVKNDTLLPILLADNERHLREQPYLNDVRILVDAVPGTADSVDITVLTKDVLSIGGKFKMSSWNKVETALKDDNFMGLGDRLQGSVFYDQVRRKRVGFGGEYAVRNIAGSFVDGYLGFQDFASTFNSFHKQERTLYASFVRPLVNPYIKWTYALESAWHQNSNMYLPDSLYRTENQYSYFNVDAWGGFNIGATRGERGNDRLRTLVAARIIHQDFQQVPEKYEQEYFYQYADLTAVLGSISIFRQDFYKTQYVYGFGRNEDVPEGLDVSVTTGWTNKHDRVRPYMGFDVEFNHFNRKDDYFHYTLRVGGYSHKKKYEDISVLGNLEYFSRLRQLGRRWWQRTFVTAGIATQLKRQLNEPLLLESQYGLPEYENVNLGGNLRFTLKAESVFFSNWSLLSFRFAPFVFGNATLLTPQDRPLLKTNLYNTLGAGIRSRNESLIFGTFELRGYFFPGRNFNGDSFRVDFSTNVRFKYNSQLVRRPEFIVVN